MAAFEAIYSAGVPAAALTWCGPANRYEVCGVCPIPFLRWLFPDTHVRWYNSSPSTVVLDQLEEVVAGCHRDSRMVPLALVNLVSMLHSRCRIELHGLVEIDDEPASVLGSQLRSVRVFRCGALPVMRVGCACCSDLHSRHIIVLV